MGHVDHLRKKFLPLHKIEHSYDYYTSEEFFLYNTTVDKWTIHHFTPQKELLTGSYFFLLLHSYHILVHFEKSWHLIG